MDAVAASRRRLEKSCGQKLPFDDQVLKYLLNVTSASDNSELLELVEDFCPRWEKHERASLAADLKREAATASLAPPSLQKDAPVAPFGNDAFGIAQNERTRSVQPLQSTSSAWGGGQTRAGVQDSKQSSSSGDVVTTKKSDDFLASDLLLAQMLQEEEDAKLTITQASQLAARQKGKAKKATYTPLNVNYVVSKSTGAATSAFGNAAASSLADVLRNRRSQEARGMNFLSEHFGPSAQGNGASQSTSSWAPAPFAGQAMSWAERAQLASEKAGDVPDVAVPAPLTQAKTPAAPLPRAAGSLRIRIRTTTGVEYMVDATPSEPVGELKRRLEKSQGIPFAQQRLLYLGRELSDGQELAAVGFKETLGNYTLQLVTRSSTPATAPVAPDMKIRLQLPGNSSSVEMTGLPFGINGSTLKQYVQRDHGIRADHVMLSFYGHAVSDEMALTEQGVASGALITVTLCPPSMPNGLQSGREAPALAAAPPRQGLQTSSHGRVMDESEALRLALEASLEEAKQKPSLDDDSGDVEDLSAGLNEASLAGNLEILADVTITESRIVTLLPQAKAIATAHSYKDLIRKVSRKSGYRLTLVLSKAKKNSVLGYIVYRFRLRIMNILQVAIAEHHRGQGLARLLLRWAVGNAKQAGQVDTVAITTPTSNIALLGKLGFLPTGKDALEDEDPLDGHACLEWQVRRHGHSKAFPLSGKRSTQKETSVPMTRATLIREVFKSLDEDRNGILFQQEMGRFAFLTGYDGGDDAWAQEFSVLCTDNGLSPVHDGINISLFEQLVNDQSDNGIYCTDTELRDMLSTLPRVESDADEPKVTGSRADFLKRVFDGCDQDGDGFLSLKEMGHFAILTGFDCGDDLWAQEYSALCSENNVSSVPGLNYPLFAKLVDDQSDNGIYCTDKELIEMLAKLPQRSQKVPASSSSSRTALLRQMFDACDKDRDSLLNLKEMGEFAVLTGFDGGEHAWAEEYNTLCREHGIDSVRSGINHAIFCKLANDPSDDGIYCTDAELSEMLSKLIPSEPIARNNSQPLAPMNSQATIKQDSSLVRSKLISSLFDACDKDGDGHLNGQEMWHFAVKTGFDAGETAWAQEYAALCSEHGRQVLIGIDKRFFEQLVNDQSDNGIYCSDQELSDMLKNSEKPKPEPARAPVQMQNTSVAVQPMVQFQGGDTQRVQLISKIFETCDQDGDGHLNSKEMLKFAEQTGFDGGGESEWAQEYAALCADHGNQIASHKGVDRFLFEKLVNDQSDNGIYCSNEELSSMLQSLETSKPQQANASEAGSERARLISRVFQLCDADADGCLNQKEMFKFAAQTGFDDSTDAWAQEYAILCAENGVQLGRDRGVNSQLFEKLLNDPSDKGIYCSDEELKKMFPLLLTPKFTDDPAQASSAGQIGSAHTEEQGSLLHSSRTSLIRQVFELCDEDKDGLLRQEEMARFAALTGFDGGEDAWAQEYAVLCSENLVDVVLSGVHFELFVKLVNDESDAGIHCSHEELREMLSKLSRSKEVVQPVLDAPAGAHAAHAEAPNVTAAFATVSAIRPPPGLHPPAEDSARATVKDRPDLLGAVFVCCDHDANGVLSCEEMHTFAALTGFEGNEFEWQQEFELICRESNLNMSTGLGFEQFCRIANDPVEYCADDELRSVLTQLQNRPGRQAIVLTLPSQPCVETASSSASRAALVKGVFQALDADEDGYLNRDEMKVFAVRVGFDGGDAAWALEFNNLCSEHGAYDSLGIDATLFSRLVEDHSDSGCYATDAELNDMFRQLFPTVQDRHRQRLQQGNHEQPPDKFNTPCELPLLRSRSQLIEAVFNRLDLRKSGRLRSAEMKVFAELCGFLCSDQEWQHEYANLLSRDRGRSQDSGVCLAFFSELVNDQSDQGSYCTDEELAHFLDKLHEVNSH